MPAPTPDKFEQLINGLGRLPRSGPRRDLFSGIEKRIARPEAVVVPLQQWRGLAAAAVLLLLLNVAALLYYTTLAVTPDQTYALLSDYSYY